MKIQIRRSDARLTKVQRTTLEGRLVFVLARFRPRIDRVVVQLSSAEGLTGHIHCRVEVSVGAELVTVEHADLDIYLAVEHAAARAARSVGRAIEKRAW